MRQLIESLPVKPVSLDVVMSLPAAVNATDSAGTPINEGSQHGPYLVAEANYVLMLLLFAITIFMVIYTWWCGVRHVFVPFFFGNEDAIEGDGTRPHHPLESIVIYDEGAPSQHGPRGGLVPEGRSRTNSKTATEKRSREACVSPIDIHQSKGAFASTVFVATLSDKPHLPPATSDVVIPAASSDGGHSSAVETAATCAADAQSDSVEPLLGGAPSAKEKLLAEQARARLYGNKSDDAATVGDDATSAPVVLPSGPEPAAFDLVYYARHELAALEDDDCHSVVSNALGSLESKPHQWTEVIAGLNLVRQLGIHHSSVLGPRLHEAVPLVVQHVKSLRSSVCKTALLCVSDLTEDFGDALLPLLDVGSSATSLLSQLLTKAASKDKKFVIEEAERCLNTVCVTLDPTVLYPMLIPYLKHKNQKIRASACGCLAAVIGRIPHDRLFSTSAANGKTAMTEVLDTAAPLVSDKTQQAREASRQILLLLREAFYRHNGTTDDDHSPSWESFVAAEIKTPTAASAILKVTASSPSSGAAR